jgi:hypothetical protein
MGVALELGDGVKIGVHKAKEAENIVGLGLCSSEERSNGGRVEKDRHD